MHSDRARTLHAISGRLRDAGFTLFELILVIILVGLFSGILLGRFLGYQEMAEKAAMEQTVGALRSALAIQSAALIARGRADEVAKLADVNPMTLLVDRQRNYAGEYFELKAGDVPPGSWYFDLRRKELVYLVDRATHFTADGGSREVRYKVGLVYHDHAPVLHAPRRDLGGITLLQVTNFAWKPE